MDDITRYRREVMKQLQCSRHEKKSCLSKLDYMLSMVQSDSGNTCYEQLILALGTPHEIANTFFEDLTGVGRERFWQRVMFLRTVTTVIVAILLTILLLFAIGKLSSPFQPNDDIIYEDGLQNSAQPPTTAIAP